MSDPNSQLGIGEIVASKYRVDQVIGEGGMGTVYAATHQVTGKRVALKWMLPQLSRDAEAVGRFLREAQAAGRINHPNVVDVYDVGKHGDSMFIVMELLRGEPLASIVDRGRVPWPDALRLLMPALRGVAAAHDGGVVHRDLKPDNIFITCDHDGTRRDAKVLDFGISKLTTKAQGENLRLTKTGSVMGTPYYMAPEQIQGIRDIDERTDIYALGVILYQTLAGDLPFKAQTYHALIVEIATGTPTPLRQNAPDVPPELEAMVMRAMAREPDRRFQTVRDLMASLETLESTSFSNMPRPDSMAHREPSMRVQAVRPATAQTLTPFTSDSPSVRTSARSSMLVWVGGALLGLLVIGGGSALGVYALTRSSSSSHTAAPTTARPESPRALDVTGDSLTTPPPNPTPPAPVAPTTPPIAPTTPPPVQPPAGELPPLIDPTPVLSTPTAQPTAPPTRRNPTPRDERRTPRTAVHPTEVRRPIVPAAPPSPPAGTGPRRGRTGQLRPDEF
ncbi:MAG: serine/threonine protein kinase [Deltaproteobacteria bacterium]|nr:serine/threonine protein kinase [Deltaproteobacteria bacterium]